MSAPEIIEASKKKTGRVAKILAERKDRRLDELDTVQLERIIAEEKERIRELKRQGRPLDRGLAVDFTSRIMQLAEVDPAKAKEFLASLDQESMKKMAYLMSLENDRTGAFLKLAQSTGSNVKDLVEIVKLMRPNNGGVDLKGISDIFKAGVEAAKANNPKGPDSIQDGVKVIMETYVTPFMEGMKAKDKEVVNLKLKALEQRIVNPIEWFKAQKDIAGELGLSSGAGKSAMDLKIEEMRQSHDIDMAKLSWEQQKYVLTQEAERDKWGAIRETFNPIFQMAAPEVRGALKKIGKDVGKTLNQPPGPKTPAEQPNIAKFTCPSCKTELGVPIPPNAPEEVPIKCPKCQTVTPAKLSKEPATTKEETSKTMPRVRPKYV